MAYYPPVGFHFRVDFALAGIATGSADARFQSVSGLNAEMGTETIDEGGVNTFIHKVPTRAQFGNLILKRGVLIGSPLAEWFRLAIEHYTFAPIPVTVSLLNENHIPLRTWNFLNAYPVKWNVTDLNAQENSIVVETIELAYSYFIRV